MPKRLIYSPKVYLYTKAQNGATYNLTNYVVSGEVQRMINQVSSAQVTLRNPNKVFTGGQGQDRAFHPMDPITIYLERVQGKPVRVFTGYLDKTPYYQMFPGTITLTASCTLKRLLYTYFDPSLPYVNGFFAKYGWTRYGSGSIISSAAYPTGGQAVAATPAAVDSGQQPFTDLTDGSLGKLLWAVLYDIGEWQDANIWIENLPSGSNGVATRMAALMRSLQTGEATATSEMQAFLDSVIGSNSQGSGAGNSQGGVPGQPSGPIKGAKQIVQTVEPIANKYNVPMEMVLAVMDVETTFNNQDSAGNPHYGWFQCQLGGCYRYGPWSTGGYTIADCHDLGLSCTAFCAAAAGLADAQPSLRQDIHQWAMVTQGVNCSNNPRYCSFWSTALADAQSMINAYGGKGGTSTGSKTIKTQSGATSPANNSGSTTPYFPLPKGSGSAAQSSWSLDQGVDISAPGGTPLLAIADGTVTYVNLQGFSNGSDKNVPVLQLDTPIGGYSYVYYGHADTAGHTTDNSHVTAGQQIGEVGNGIVGISTGPHLEIGFATNSAGQPAGPQSASTMQSTLQAAQTGAAVPGGGTGGGTSGGSTGATSGQQNASAFVTDLNLPSIEDMTVAVALGAEHRGLMHDQNLLPFVQQITQASLRSFQSLPNGDFYAFYPDYFGEMGNNKAYWDIKDLEILSGGIDLNDDALATHVFAVGDNTWPVNDELINDLMSTGAINIFNAFVGTGVIDKEALTKNHKGDGLDPGVMDAKQAVEFIQRYGARPLVQQYPMVRNPIFEMLLAYQQFMFAWSNQFKTSFSFTFMPELYPGGRVSFSEHGLEMYINAVTHTFNYAEGGFTTTADLTAPSAMKGARDPDLPPFMVQALVEPIKLPGNTITAQPGDPLDQAVRQIAQTIASGIQKFQFGTPPPTPTKSSGFPVRGVSQAK